MHWYLVSEFRTIPSLSCTSIVLPDLFGIYIYIIKYTLVHWWTDSSNNNNKFLAIIQINLCQLSPSLHHLSRLHDKNCRILLQWSLSTHVSLLMAHSEFGFRKKTCGKCHWQAVECVCTAQPPGWSTACRSIVVTTAGVCMCVLLGNCSPQWCIGGTQNKYVMSGWFHTCTPDITNRGAFY